MSLRKIAGLLAVAGLTLGLIGGGIGANFTDQVTATQNIDVGTFACQIVGATPATAVIASGGKSVSYTAPTIMSSAASSAPFSFTVQNTGSIPQSLTVSTSPVGVPFSIIGAPFAAVPLASMATHVYNTGLQWGVLTNANLGTSGTVTWTVDCGEVPATQTITSSQLNFGPTGWGGWSCPAGKAIVSASMLDVADGGNGLVASLTPWKPGASVVGLNGVTYNFPVTPFGYTYGAGEEGAIAQNDNDSDAMKIVLVCSL